MGKTWDTYMERHQRALLADQGNQLALSSAWRLWEHQHSGDYNCDPLGSCDSIGSFWRLFNNIPEPRAFFTPSRDIPRRLVGRRKVDSYSIFREGVKPEWEDPLNAVGGEILFRSEKLELVNKVWYELVLALVGEVIPLAKGTVLGARILDKSGKGKLEYRVEVWYGADVDPQELIEQVRAALKPLGANLSFSVRSHTASLQKSIDRSAKAKSRSKGKPASQGQGDIQIPAPAPIEQSKRTVHLAA